MTPALRSCSWLILAVLRYQRHMAEYRRLSVRNALAYFPFSALTYAHPCVSCHTRS